jgi:hypothetical protein
MVSLVSNTEGQAPGTERRWPKWLAPTGAVWLAVLLVPSLWAAASWKANAGGAPASGGTAPVAVAVAALVVTLALGILLGARKLLLVTCVLALVGGIVEGGGSIYVTSASPGPHSLSMSDVAVNVAAGLAAVSVVLGLAFSVGRAYRRGADRRKVDQLPR